MDKISFIISIIFNLLNLDVSIKIQLCLCYDEAHRVTKNTSVSGQLEADMTTMARESRKWNLSIGLYTQSIDDIPDIIIELATTIVILGAATDKSIADMGERFGLNRIITMLLRTDADAKGNR